MPKRCVVFFDGQNLYHGARESWAPYPPDGKPTPYSWPSFDVQALADALVARDQNRALSQIRFYTGVPSPKQNFMWHGFWSNKLRFLRSQGHHVFRGRINPSGQEKGVDVSIAIDLIRLTYEKAYDVAIIVSADSDLGPAVQLARSLGHGQGLSLEFESAYAFEAGRHIPRGIPGTTWVQISKGTYDACYDSTEYRPKIPGKS